MYALVGLPQAFPPGFQSRMDLWMSVSTTDFGAPVPTPQRGDGERGRERERDKEREYTREGVWNEWLVLLI